MGWTADTVLEHHRRAAPESAMPKINTEWKVEPHGPLERLDDGLATVAGEIRMPLGRFPRRMTVVSLEGGRSAIWSAIPVDEQTM